MYILESVGVLTTLRSFKCIIECQNVDRVAQLKDSTGIKKTTETGVSSS